MSFGGNGTSSQIATNTDVTLNNHATGQVLAYDATIQKWQNSSLTNKLDTSVVGANNGVAGLDGGGHLAATNLPIGVPVVVNEASGSYPVRPAYTGEVWWKGPDQPTGGGTTGGGAGAVNGVDSWIKTAS